MKKTFPATAFISLLLILAVTGTQLVDFAEANFTLLPELPPPIYIRNDGSIEPSSFCKFLSAQNILQGLALISL